jgi:transposase-like protein
METRMEDVDLSRLRLGCPECRQRAGIFKYYIRKTSNAAFRCDACGHWFERNDEGLPSRPGRPPNVLAITNQAQQFCPNGKHPPSRVRIYTIGEGDDLKIVKRCLGCVAERAEEKRLEKERKEEEEARKRAEEE